MKILDKLYLYVWLGQLMMQVCISARFYRYFSSLSLSSLPPSHFYHLNAPSQADKYQVLSTLPSRRHKPELTVFTAQVLRQRGRF